MSWKEIHEIHARDAVERRLAQWLHSRNADVSQKLPPRLLSPNLLENEGIPRTDPVSFRLRAYPLIA